MTRSSRTRRSWIAAVLLISAASIGIVQSADAVPVLGVLNITGSARVTQTTIDFLPLAGGEGIFAIDPFTQTGTFAPLAGTAGDIGDLNSAAQPVGVPFLFPAWMTFDANPAIQFDLTFINPGVFSAALCGAPPAAGQNCTPPGSAFNLTNVTATSSVASFQVNGNAIGTMGEITPFTGTFSTQFVTQNYQQLLATIFGGGFVEATYSANFEVVPEPAPLLLLGSGLTAVGIMIRRWRRRA